MKVLDKRISRTFWFLCIPGSLCSIATWRISCLWNLSDLSSNSSPCTLLGSNFNSRIGSEFFFLFGFNQVWVHSSQILEKPLLRNCRERWMHGNEISRNWYQIEVGAQEKVQMELLESLLESCRSSWISMVVLDRATLIGLLLGNQNSVPMGSPIKKSSFIVLSGHLIKFLWVFWNFRPGKLTLKGWIKAFNLKIWLGW